MMHSTQPLKAIIGSGFYLSTRLQDRFIRFSSSARRSLEHSYTIKVAFGHFRPFSQRSNTRFLRLPRIARVPHTHQSRNIHVSTVLIPPLVFTGLFLALWTWKCLMMVVFQNKIIYMPSMPPFSRSERIVDYEQQCKPVEWREEGIISGDGTEVTLAIGSVPSQAATEASGNLVVLYFQGNGSSLPPRLPGLSRVIKAANASSSSGENFQFTIVALSYRGFWTSKGRPSERGIALDADAAVAWVSKSFPTDTQLVLWGQSLGAGVAVAATAAIQQSYQPKNTNLSLEDTAKQANLPEVKGLILETPFTSIKDMLAALYPQRWLPYRHLWPFLRSHWDSRRAVKLIAELKNGPQILILQAAQDELVPQAHAVELEKICVAGQMKVKRLLVHGALHHDVLEKGGRPALVRFLKQV